MNTPALERFLAGIYVDAEARARFLAAPYEEAKRAGLPEEQCRALEAIDRVGLEMAAHSLSRRRGARTNVYPTSPGQAVGPVHFFSWPKARTK